METDEANETVAEGSSPEEETAEIDCGPAEEVLKSFPNKRRFLIPILQKIQDAYRFLPPETVEMVMAALRVKRAEVYGVISFYPQFRTEEPGKYILKLCYGTACFVKGAPIIGDKIKEIYHIGPGQTDDKKLFTLQLASCLGNCGAAPMAIIGDDTHGTIDPDKTTELLASYENRED